MDLFDNETLDRYYRNSWVLDPHTNTVGRVYGMDGDNCLLRTGTATRSVNKNDLDWKHVRTPELGYRNSPCGKYVMYLERAAIRGTAKGFNAATIRISIPPICMQAAQALDISIARPALSDAIAKEAFFPTFMSLKQALKYIADEDSVCGVALNHSWALCLGVYEEMSYVLYLRGTLVATSEDGAKWAWLDPAAEELFNSSVEIE